MDKGTNASENAASIGSKYHEEGFAFNLPCAGYSTSTEQLGCRVKGRARDNDDHLCPRGLPLGEQCGSRLLSPGASGALGMDE